MSQKETEQQKNNDTNAKEEGFYYEDGGVSLHIPPGATTLTFTDVAGRVVLVVPWPPEKNQ